MAKRLTRDEWATARQTWEMEQAATDTSVAALFGITRQAVALKRHAEGWQKVGALATVSQRAQLAADKKNCVEQDKPSRADAIDTAVDIRADVLGKHRAEWAQHRALFPLENIRDDFNAGKSAKISAEMVRIRQDGERRAYGISDETQQTDTGGKDVAEMNLAELAQALRKPRAERV